MHVLRLGRTSPRLAAAIAAITMTGCTVWEALDDPWSGLGEGDADVTASEAAAALGTDGGTDASGPVLDGDAASDGAADSHADGLACSGSACDSGAGNMAEAGPTAMQLTAGDGGAPTVVAVAALGETLYGLGPGGLVLQWSVPGTYGAPLEGGAFSTMGMSTTPRDIVATDAGCYWTDGNKGIHLPDGGLIDAVNASSLSIFGDRLAWTVEVGPNSATVSTCLLSDCGGTTTTIGGPGVFSNVVVFDGGVAWASQADGSVSYVVSTALDGGTHDTPLGTTGDGNYNAYLASDEKGVCVASSSYSPLDGVWCGAGTALTKVVSLSDPGIVPAGIELGGTNFYAAFAGAGSTSTQAHFGTFFHGGSFGPTDIDSGTIDGAIEGTETETDIAATHLLAIDGNGQYLFYIDRNQHLWQVRLPL